MSLTDKETLELHELCNGLVDGTLSEADQHRLEAWLKTSEDARQFYVRSLSLSASLYQYAGEMITEAPLARPGRSRKIIPAWFWKIGAPLAAAAVFALAFWLGSNRSSVSEADAASEADGDEMVARISGANDCRWAGSPILLGDELRSGQQLDLVAGAAEITFDSGAQIVLEAPASLEVSSAWNAVLRRGTLKATVPAEAVGFRVTNAAVDVVDLGTEFSMVADDRGGTDVFVLKGSVETTARDGGPPNRERLVLHEKQAWRFARTGVSEVPDREARLARMERRLKLDRIRRPFGYAHWDFDSVKDGVFTATAVGLPLGKYEMALKDGTPSSILQSSGRWGSALNLDGSTVLESPFPKLSARSPRTIAFWARVAADSELSDAGPAVAWLLAGKEARAFRVGWNRNPGLGGIGVLDTHFARRNMLGATPLRDGQWHHITVVITPNRKNDVGMQIRQYTDGRLDGVAVKPALRRRGGEGRKELGISDLTADILSIGGTNPSSEHFRGSLDELYVCDRALIPREIAYLMRKNQAPVPDMLAAE